jgi:type IV secretory pathway VirB9-like protein
MVQWCRDRIVWWVLGLILCVAILWLTGCASMDPAMPSAQPDPIAVADAQDAERRRQVEASLQRPIMPAVPIVEFDEPPLKNPVPTITQANTRALMTPRPEWFARGTLYFPYRAGALYQVYTSVNQPTTFAFPPDELLLRYVGLEGKERWTVVQSDLDDGGVKQSILVVMPNEPKLKGGLTLVTTKSFYHLQLISQAETGVLDVRWRRPEDPVPKARVRYDTGALHVGFDIALVKGSPLWKPTQVWDTGLQGKTVIAFPPELEVTNAPLVFVPNAAGQLEQVNYRKLGTRYVVDLVAPQLELRIGLDDAAEVVRISRAKNYRWIRCPGSAECPIPEGT